MVHTSRRLSSSLEVRRVLTLFVSVLVSLASGTNYVFSAYAPQLAARLHISHTQLNVIGLAGNVGICLGAPLWGAIIDKTGPKPGTFAGFCLLLVGYLGMRVIYDTGTLLSDSNTSIPTGLFLLLVLFSFMTGAGGSGGYVASLNVTAKSFPDSLRGSTVGLVLSGLGLSAFIFSFIARHAFPADTSSLLLTLALGTALPMLIGFVFLRPVPLQESSPVVISSEPTSQTPLLVESASRRVPKVSSRALLEHIHGWKLVTSLDFCIFFCVFTLVGGTGLMYINNVGSMAQILYIHENYPKYEEIEVSKWQATQVSIISLSSFVGRIFIGVLSDFSKAHFAFPRSYLLTLVTATALASQIAASRVDLVSHLWKSSGLLGLGYGMFYSLSTSIVSEWFGLVHFSETLGILIVSPLIAGNIFSVAFGKNLDAHESPQNLLQLIGGKRQCLLGRTCYVDTLYLTIVGCTVSVLLSVWAGWRDHKRIKNALNDEEFESSDL